MKTLAMDCPLKSGKTWEKTAEKTWEKTWEETPESNFDVLLHYSAGKLDRERSALLERHMLLCADCAAFLAGQTELWQALDSWEPEPVGMDFNRRLWRRIDAEASLPWYRKFGEFLHISAWKPALPLAAAVVLVAAGFVMDHQNARPLAPGVETASGGASRVSGVSGVSAIDADQLEKTLDDLQLLRQLDASAAGSAPSRTM